MDYKPYESLTQRGIRRNRESERAIIASGICAFISSLFANGITGGQLGPRTIILIPFTVFLYLLIYWIYLICYKLILNCEWVSSFVLGKLYREDVLHIINIEITKDLTELLKSCTDNSINQSLLAARALYQIANILDFLEKYSGVVYISNTASSRHIISSDSFVSESTLKTIFKEIEEISQKCFGTTDDFKRVTERLETVRSKYFKSN